jgi:hypothetical protein
MRLLPKRNPRKFTEAESFCFFIEGVRALQLYDNEADQPQPEQQVLKATLHEAEEKFRKCVERYSKDILPLYYFGIVASLKGQVEQACQLKQELLGAKPDTMTDEPDRLFLRAAAVFEKVSQETSGDLLAYAQYNQALALAKTEPMRTH